MKKLFTLNNAIVILLILYAAYSQLPVLTNNFFKEGQIIEGRWSQTISVADSGKRILFPGSDRELAIFWATWCAPCKLEMARLSASVNEGKIPRGAVIAINPFESPEKVREFMKRNSFPFTFIEDNGISLLLNVRTTPTTLFIEKNKVIRLSSGLSLFGIWTAEQFL